MPLDLHVVAHTHWDREWYHTAEQFRVRLVSLVDELLDEPPHPGESFLLDGQGIMLEDYLLVRPERAGELSALLRDGRLEAGPWYVLADELIPSGEALVRNLLAGRELVRRLRGDPPPVLYCPDAFGHPAILPDLACGFGCDLIVLWRGYGSARSPLGDTVRWRSASGTEALLYHLSTDGYEFGVSLPLRADEARARWRRIEEALEPRASTGVSLLLNGADHHARQRGQHAAVAALAAAAAPARVVSSTLRAASGAIVSATDDSLLPLISGELRDSYGCVWTLQGTLGTRAAQKRANARLERRLVRDVEPWLALLPSGGSAAMRAILRATWRDLLRCHPHDTLCGTSIDAVAESADARFAAVDHASRAMRERVVLDVAGHDAERARDARAEWKPVVVLRNPVARARSGVAELTLRAFIADVAVGPGSASRQGDRRRVPPWHVGDMPLQLLSRRECVELTESPRAYPDADLVSEVTALGWVDAIDGYSVRTVAQRGAEPVAPPSPVHVRELTIDNGLLRVSVSETGRVHILALATGVGLDDVITLEAHADVGDLYTPAIREELPAPVVHRVRVTHHGPLRGEIAVDYTLGAHGRDAGRCQLRLQLDAALPALRVIVTGENRRPNQRLRLRAGTGLARAATLADAAFHPIVRTPLVIGADEEASEKVVPTAPLHRFVSRFGEGRGVTLFSDGLAEYESCGDGAIAVTLVRSVGALSRHDLPERPGHAGWPADTPGAQSLGPFAARFALALHADDCAEVREEIERLAEDVLLPIAGETLRSNLEPPHASGGLALGGDGLAFSAAMPAQREGWIVLRCVNRRAESVAGSWTLGRAVREAHRCRLDETPVATLDVDGHRIAFIAGPYEIVSVLMR